MKHKITIRRLDKVSNGKKIKWKWRIIKEQVLEEWCLCASFEVDTKRGKRTYAVSTMPEILDGRSKNELFQSW